MNTIPKNNLHERMLKLGYKPELMKIVPPVLDNSKVVKEEVVFIDNTKPNPSAASTGQDLRLVPFNIDDWSDFEEDDW